MSRCSDVYAPKFEKVDVLDLQPEWGKLDLEKRGDLIACSLHQVGERITPKKYDAIIGNWSLCYLGFTDIENVLTVIKDGLKTNGYLLLKEPILKENEEVPWLCPSGQWQHIRPRHVYQEYFDQMFKEVKT